ncbi:unnamed protein product [Acanthoscelides obtectus]|uniref:Uncharacterized protein n=1 Tax=Acanthoscelides obtectus TaxID=200917 RepID=A0A9P0M591_ACAOB|nr:unnamed protein product [Acanthoscelides obtectus]CAH1974167.1 unnamed protein product [Acanthoscelides obtectus]CAH2012011.1 unnamed protein product [Acanthoscelides obtectus]CAK1632393.1 hypothetical protein AOBTE_LOCUS7532 [Acanthoscelides obtectus]CAK1632428.1 hypothetical protein AOBTE_LOCUS7558 [Acanthoscelides obtectus]
MEANIRNYFRCWSFQKYKEA